jgi:hypothetical protein
MEFTFDPRDLDRVVVPEEPQWWKKPLTQRELAARDARDAKVPVYVTHPAPGTIFPADDGLPPWDA